MADAQKLTGVKYDINNLSDVYEAIHAVQGELNITGTTATEASTTLTGSFNSMKSAFQDFMGNLAIGADIGPSLQALAETMSTFFFENLLPMIGNILMALPEALITFISTAVPLMIDGGTKLLSGMGTGFLESLPTLIGNLGSILGSIITALLEFLPKVLEKGVEIIGNLAKGILDNWPAISKSIVDTLVKLISTIVSKLPEFLKKGMELIAKIAYGIVSNIPAVLTAIATTIGQIIAALAENFPKFVTKGIDFLIQLGAGIIQGIPEAVGKIPQLITGLINRMKSFLNDFTGIGKDIVRGLWNGIVSVKDWILGKISGFVDNIVDGIRSFFKIGSPSKVMADKVGHFIPEGLAVGIEDNLRPVARAMDEMGSIATNDFESELRMGVSSSVSGTPGWIESGISSPEDDGTPLVLNLHLLDHDFRAIVEDITKLQDETLQLRLAF